MLLVSIPNTRAVFRRLQWARGLRAGIAVGVALLVCHRFGHPSGWAALGGLYVNQVDNGGPFRSRLANILTLLLGGALAVWLGVLAGAALPLAIAVSFAFCFLATFSRVFSQPLAAAGVMILVLYVVAVGGQTHTAVFALGAMLDFTLGSLWAALLALVLWPNDPFRPARLATADAFAALSRLVAALPAALDPIGPELTHAPAFHEALGQLRLHLEEAQQAIAATPARMTARTIRARNLTVAVESADLLIARLLRFNELSRPATNASREQLSAIAAWLTHALAPIEPALRAEPAGRGEAFTREGSLWIDLHRSEQPLEAALRNDPALCDTLEETLLTLEIIYAAVRAIWTGYEPRRIATPAPDDQRPRAALFLSGPVLDTLRANLTVRSLIFRHALRLAFVVALDQLITHFVHRLGAPGNHGYWLAMTSLIVLQPYTGETVRKSGQRVLGTVAGAVLAAALAAALPGDAALLAFIALGSLAAVAVYSVDYAWYCFFLTPTIVLMTLPHLHDWRYAAVRMGMTLLGAVIAVLAMLLLWPERESLQLPRLLGRGAAAEAAYLRATLAYWQHLTGSDDRLSLERTLLAPARRRCGLAANEAEETLDRALLEHAIPLNPERHRTARLNSLALAFTTYLRRLTQTITAAAAAGRATPASSALLNRYSNRLDLLADALSSGSHFILAPEPSAELTQDAALHTDQIHRLERQITVLETTAADLSSL